MSSGIEMNPVGALLLKIKRAETPFYARLKRFLKSLLALDLPIPPLFLPLYRGTWRLYVWFRRTVRWLWVALYRKPVTRSLCVSAGDRLTLDQIPAIAGNVRLSLGDDVTLSGKISIRGGRVFDSSEIRVGNRVFIGNHVTLMVCRQIVIEDDVLIAQGCVIADNSGHPLDAERRIAGEPPETDSVRPVRIGRKAWVGWDSMILPGVTIGEGAVIGARSLVTKDVPPYTVCAGNPAKIVKELNPEIVEANSTDRLS